MNAAIIGLLCLIQISLILSLPLALSARPRLLALPALPAARLPPDVGRVGQRRLRVHQLEAARALCAAVVYRRHGMVAFILKQQS